MRVLLGVHALTPTSLGGTEQAVWSLARGLAQHHHVLLFYPLPLGLFPVGTEERRVQGGSAGGQLEIRGRTLARTAAFRESFASPAAEQWFASLLEQFKPDVVHLHHLSGLSFRLPQLAQAAGVPVIWTAHDYFWSCARGQRLELNLERCPGPAPERCAHCMSDQLRHDPLAHDGWKRRLIQLARRVLEQPSLVPIARRLPLKSIQEGLHRMAALVPRPTVSRSAPASSSPSPAALRVLEMRLELSRQALEACDLLVAPSQHMLAQLRAEGIPAERCRWMDNVRWDGPPTELQPPRARQAGPLRIGFVGALIPSKGPQVLLQALTEQTPPRKAASAGPRQQARRPRWQRCVLVGPQVAYHRCPNFRLELLEQAVQAGAEVLPAVPPHDIQGLLRTLDVLVVPSIWEENAPTIIIEAQEQGLPVVASDLGGIPELVEAGVSGLLVPPGDALQLREALLHLAETPALWSSLSRGAWLRGQARQARSQTLQQAVAPHLALYQSLLAGRPPRC